MDTESHTDGATNGAVDGVTLFCGQEMTSARRVPLDGYEVLVYSACSPSRVGNEDAAAVLSFGAEGIVLVVADGVGGQAAGAAASKLAIEMLASSLAAAVGAGARLRSGILDGIEEANKAVNALGVGAGTTLAVAALKKDGVRSYHVGDSMVLLVGQRGKRKLETIAHSPTGYAVEAGLLDADEALLHEDRHYVSNIVGSEEMHIDIGPSVPMSARDTLLLASDGLSDNLSTDEIVKVIRKGSLERAALTLATLAGERMAAESGPSKPDDLTFVLARKRD